MLACTQEATRKSENFLILQEAVDEHINFLRLVHHILPLRWTNILVCPSSDKSRHPLDFGN